MAEPRFIDPAQSLPPHQNYPLLRDEAIAHISSQPGASWSDFNASEPGLILLEGAVDALADLGYRLEHSIADLLAPNGVEDDWQPLPDAASALSVACVSQQDIEAVLADHPAVNSASLLPPDPDSQRRDVLLTPCRGLSEPARAAIIPAVWRRFHASRPLGMQPGCVSLRDKALLRLYPELELAEHAPVEATLAALIRRWQDYLAAQPVYLAADACLANGDSGDTVYAGPLLQKGVLKNRPAARQRVLASELISLACDSDGIARLDSLLLGDSDGQRATGQWHWALPEHSYAELDLDTLLDWWQGKLTLPRQDYSPLHRHGQRLPLDVARLRQLLAADSAATDSNGPSPASHGRYRRLSQFPPFALGLPAAFGVGRSGLNPAASAAEQAAPLQLQAYLLFMEQLLANQSAQLDNIRRLLEIPAGPWLAACGQLLLKMQRNEALAQHEIDHFWQVIRALPPTLRRQPVSPLPTAAQLFDPEALASYREAATESALEGILDPRWLDRQSRRLRHLLARFGESQPDASVLRYRGMYRPLCGVLLASRHAPALDAGELAERLAALRQVLDLAAALQTLPALGGERGLAANLLASTGSRSGLERRIAQQLGFILDDAPLSLGNREGLYLIEGALLTQNEPRRFMGYRLADCLFWVLPAYGTRLGNSAFRQLVGSVIAAETPLHLVPMICWLGANDLNIVENTYRHWRAKWVELGMPPAGEAPGQRDSGLTRRQRLESASGQLLAALARQDFLIKPDTAPWQSHIGHSELAHNFTVGYADIPPRRILRPGSRIGDAEQPFVVGFTPPLPLQD